ncbi:MAG: 50S ribosomal protein L5 [bacterium]
MRLAEIYKKQIVPKLREEFGYTNLLAVPRLDKVTVNVGVGRNSKDKQHLEAVVNNLTAITGQRPVVVKARKSISSFKVREGDNAGVMVTLRGQQMYDFVEKLINVTLPRVRDFRGIASTKVDRGGNLSIGFREQTPFPEIKAEKTDIIHGLEVNLATTAKTKEEGLRLLALLGFPFIK